MKTVFDVLRQPLVIGALVLSILIVVGVYFGSHWYYGDVEPVEIPEGSAPTPYLPKNLSSAKVDLSGLQGESLPPQQNLHLQFCLRTVSRSMISWQSYQMRRKHC